MEFIEVIKKREKMCNYYSSCTQCPLFKPKNENNNSCEEYISKYPETAEKLIIEWETPIDWTNISVDTKILVRDNISCKWRPRYFAKYENGVVYAWRNGGTSWSCEEGSHSKYKWNYAKLAE